MDSKKNIQTDIPQKSFLQLLPRFFHPYGKLARWDRPIGTWLLYLPCLWGLAFALKPLSSGGALIPWPHIIIVGLLFFLGAFVMRGAGCTWNDITDRHIDAKVARTASRPLPAKQVTVKQAVLFMALQMGLGLLILLYLPFFAQLIALSSIFLVIYYPFMKRITWWPQLWLGLTFNWGVLVAWAALQPSLSLAPLLLYVAGIFWTLGYDTIYAHQDKVDDALIGVRSTALRLGVYSRPFILGFYTVTLVFIGLTGLILTMKWPFYVIWAIAGVHLLFQVYRIRFDDPKSCLAVFKSNQDFGLLITLAALLGL